MTIETAVKIDVDVNGIQNVKQAAETYEDLGDAVAKTQREAEALALQYGINDQRTQDAIKRAGQYKYQLEQLDAAIDLNRSSMQLLVAVTTTLVNSFQAAIGAISLFGDSNEDLVRQLTKLQAAMAFTEGINNLRNELPRLVTQLRAKFIALNSTLSITQKLMRGLGVGLVVAALVAIVKNFDFIIQKVKQFTDSLGLTNYALQDQIKLQEALVNDKKRQIELLENEFTLESDLVDKQRQVLKEKQDLSNEELKLAEKRLEYAKFSKDGIEEATEDYKNALNQQKLAAQNISNFEAAIQQKRIEQQTAFNQQQFKLQQEEYLENKEQLKALEELVRQYQLDRFKIEESGFVNIRGKRNLNNLLLTDDLKAQFIIEASELRIQKEKDLQFLEEIFLKELISREQYQQRKAQIDKYYQAQEEQRQRDIKMARLNEAQQIANSTLSIYGDLYEALSSTQAQESKKYFKAQQNLAIATSIVDTYFAANKAYLSQLTLTPDSPIRAQIAAGVAIAQGLARIAVIRKQKYNPQSSPSAPGSLGNSNSGSGLINVPTTRLPQGQDILTQERRVFVLEGDITRTQRRAATNQNVSVLGG
jgi:hypothetical protein